MLAMTASVHAVAAKRDASTVLLFWEALLFSAPENG